jgi:quaternary ammonium compound-resistance protein SugE
MAWFLLIVAGLLEIVWAVALKQADGFTRFWPSTVGIGVALMSFILLTMALKTLPVGTAYAVWVSIGALGVALYGMMFLGDQVSALRVVFLVLIIVGVAGLRALET